jgi:hypothetical protein
MAASRHSLRCFAYASGFRNLNNGAGTAFEPPNLAYTPDCGQESSMFTRNRMIAAASTISPAVSALPPRDAAALRHHLQALQAQQSF